MRMQRLGCCAVAALTGLALARTTPAGGLDTIAVVSPEQHPEPGVVTLRLHLSSLDPNDQIWSISDNENVMPFLFESDGGELRQNCTVGPEGDGCECDVKSEFDLGGDSWINLGDDETFCWCECKGCCVAGSTFGPPEVSGYSNSTSPDGNKRVLIAQFSLPDGACFTYHGTVDMVPGFADGFISVPFEIQHCVCAGDFDVSGAVDFDDLLTVLAQWGPYAACPPHKPADLDKDCAVGFGDLLAVLTNWGPCG